MFLKKKLVRSNQFLQAKFQNLDLSNNKRKKLKRILLIAAISIAVGSIYYTYPPLQKMFHKIISKAIRSLRNNSNSDTLLETSDNSKKNRFQMVLIIGMTLLSSLVLANQKGFGEFAITPESIVESKYDINTNDVVTLPILVTFFPLMISISQVQPTIFVCIYTSLWIAITNLHE